MGYGHYVGRVGALAVALGIGAAIGSLPGTAWATPDADSSGATSAPAGSSDAGVSAGVTKPIRKSRSQLGSKIHTTGDTADDPGTPGTTSVKRHGTVVHPDLDDAGRGATVNDDSQSPSPAADPETRNRDKAAAPDATPSAATPTPAAAATEVAVTESAPVAAPASAAEEPVLSPSDPEPVQAFSAPITSEAQPEAAAAPEAAAVLTAAASTLFDTGLPAGAPLAAPALVLLAAGARRELTESIDDNPAVLDDVSTGEPGGDPQALTAAAPHENTPPTAHLAYVTSPGWLTGNVYGDVNAADRDWDWLHYSATDGAKGTVKINWLGQFTYTATAAARHAAAAAGATAADKTDTFTVTVSDGQGGVATVDVTVKIKPANANPNARVGTVSNPVEATGVVTGTVTATDKDGDALSFSGPTSTKKGTITVSSDGTFTYTPTAAARHAASATNAAATGANKDSFTVTVSDGKGGTLNVPVSVDISPTNTGPSQGDYSAGVPGVDGKVTGSVTAADDDHDTLTYSGSQTTAKGSVVVNSNGTFSYTPNPDARHAAAADGAAATDTTDSFDVTVADGHGGTTTVGVSVDISGHNADPDITGATTSVPDADGTLTGTVHATDADTDPLSYSGATQSAKGGTVTVNSNGTFSYTPTAAARHAAAADGAPDTDKIDSFDVTVSDGHGGTDTVTVDVDISAHNTDPEITGGSINPADADGKIAGQVSATDADNDTLTYNGTQTTAKGSVDVNSTSGAFTYTPTEEARHDAAASTEEITDSFTITVHDGHGGTDTQDITVTIAPLASTNHTPTDGTYTAGTPGADGKVTGQVSASDADNDTLTYTGNQTTAKGSVEINSASGAFTYTPNTDARHAAAATGATDALTDSFDVLVSDGNGGTLTVTVSVDIAPHNTDPQITAASSNPPGTDGKVAGSVTATDDDNDTLTYSAVTTTNGSVTINSATGAFTYTPTEAARQDAANSQTPVTDTVTVTVTDGHGGTDTQNVSVTIAPTAPNHDPINGSYEASTPDANGVVTGSVTATDPDGDPLMFTGTQSTAKGSVVVNLNNGTFTYTPTPEARHAAAAEGASTDDLTDSFTVIVADSQGGATFVEVTVEVAAANANPEITAASSNPPGSDGKVTGSVTVTDDDNDALTYTAAATDKGSATMHADGTFTYTPTQQARQDAANSQTPVTDTVTVTVTDGHGGTDTADITVTIAPAAENPSSQAVPGMPVGQVIGENGYTYQVVTDQASQQSRVIIIGPDGSTTTSGAVSGSFTLGQVSGFNFTPTPRADGSIVLLGSPDSASSSEDNPPVYKLVTVAANGAVTLNTIGAFGIPFWADDGTTYVVQPETKTITIGNESGDVDSFRVWRLDTAGALTSYTYDTGSSQYAAATGAWTKPQNAVVGPDGSLYLGFTNYSDPQGTDPDFYSPYLIGHPGVFVVPTQGAPTVIPITALTGTADGDAGSTQYVAEIADGTVYAAAALYDSIRVVTVNSTEVTTVSTIPGYLLKMAAGGQYAVVESRETIEGDDGNNTTVYRVTFIDSYGIVATVPVAGNNFSGAGLVVGPDGTAYTLGGMQNAEDEDDPVFTTIVAVTPTSTVSYSTGYPVPGDISASTFLTDYLKFASDGTAFVVGVSQPAGGDDDDDDDNPIGVNIRILSSGVSSPTLLVEDPSGMSLRVINDVAVLTVQSDSGAHIVAIDTAGNLVAQYDSNPVDGVLAGATVGDDGVFYISVVTPVDPESGGDGTPTTTVWAFDSTDAEAVFTQAGVGIGLSVNEDHTLYMPVVIYGVGEDGSPTFTTTVVTGQTAPAPPKSTITKIVDRSTGVVSGVVTVDSSYGDDLQFSGSTLGPLGQLIVNGDGSYVFMPSAAARAYAEQSGKVNNVVFGVTVTNSEGREYTIPVNVSLLRTNYPVTPSPQAYPLHSFDDLHDQIGYRILSGAGVFSARTLHAWTVDGTDQLQDQCHTAHCPYWDKYEEQLTYAGTPSLVSNPYDGTLVTPDVYLISMLSVPGNKYWDTVVLGYRKLSPGETTYIKSDMANPDRVDGDGIVTSGYITYTTVAFAPGTFPEDWFYTRIPGVVGGFIYDNELPSDAMEDVQLGGVDKNIQAVLAEKARQHRGLQTAGHLAAILGPIAVDPLGPGSTVKKAVIKGVKLGAEGAIVLIDNQADYDATYANQEYPMYLAQGPNVQAPPQIGL